MTWNYDANYDYTTNTRWNQPWIFSLETGWFQDPLRSYSDRFFYFSPNGITTGAAGHPGFTAASNLPQFLDSNGWCYDSFWRPDKTGDNVTLTLNENTSVFTGLPNHAYTGAAALTQTLDREFEGGYWEGTWYDDQFTLDIQSSNTNFRSLYYWGESGDDSFTIKGDFGVLDMNHEGSNESPSEVGQSFAGGSGYDRLIIDANSYDEFTIDYLERERGHSIPDLDDIETIFEIVGPGDSYFQAADVEEVVFNDHTFNRSEIILSGTGKTRLRGTGKDNYISGNTGKNISLGKGGDDTMLDSPGADKLSGGNGDDYLISSSDDDRDIYKGGQGNDTLYFSNSEAPVTVNLQTKSATTADSDGAVDRVLKVESVVGSSATDSLTGNAGSNLLDGSHGDDTLLGGKGNDVLIGGPGTNSLDGEKGNDTAVFEGNRDDYNVRSSDSGALVIKGLGEKTTLIGVELIEFSDQSITSESF